MWFRYCDFELENTIDSLPCYHYSTPSTKGNDHALPKLPVLLSMYHTTNTANFLHTRTREELLVVVLSTNC